jgi:octaprenyl-diphosphate synthase
LGIGHVMDGLKQFFVKETPPIEAVLRRETTKLLPLVRPVADHVLDAGGKRLRPMLCLLTARAFGFRSDSTYNLAGAFEFLHSATLLHDDILDNADLRRGRPSAHTRFGLHQTILAGDVLLALANRMVADFGQPRLMQSVSEAIMQTASGEVLEVATLGDPALTRAEYLAIITGKTACLIQSACQCGALLAGAPDPQVLAAQEFGLNLGIAFQLVDDALDYAMTAKATGKPVGGDLKEGKFTLPLLLFLEKRETRIKESLAAAIRGRRLADSEATEIVATVRDGGFAEQTRQEAQTYLVAAEKALQCFPESQERNLLTEALVYVRTREK